MEKCMDRCQWWDSRYNSCEAPDRVYDSCAGDCGEDDEEEVYSPGVEVTNMDEARKAKVEGQEEAYRRLGEKLTYIHIILTGGANSTTALDVVRMLAQWVDDRLEELDEVREVED